MTAGQLALTSPRRVHMLLITKTEDTMDYQTTFIEIEQLRRPHPS